MSASPTRMAGPGAVTRPGRWSRVTWSARSRRRSSTRVVGQAARPRTGWPREPGRVPDRHRHHDGALGRCPRRCGSARRPRGAAAPAAPAPHPPPRPRGGRHREGSTLGTGRGAARPAHRGSRRAGTLRPGHPPRRGGVPHREDLRGLAGRDQLDPRPHPVRAAHPGMGRAPREPRGLRPVRDRQDVPARGPGPTGRRGRPQGRLVHPRRPRGAATSPPRRRHRHPSHQPSAARRPGRGRRHRAAPGRPGRRRRPLPPRRRRLRETLGRGIEQPAPRTSSGCTPDSWTHHSRRRRSIWCPPSTLHCCARRVTTPS